MSFCPHFTCFEALTDLAGARTQNRNFGSEKQRMVTGPCLSKGVGDFLGKPSTVTSSEQRVSTDGGTPAQWAFSEQPAGTHSMHESPLGEPIYETVQLHLVAPRLGSVASP